MKKRKKIKWQRPRPKKTDGWKGRPLDMQAIKAAQEEASEREADKLAGQLMGFSKGVDIR